jgi:protein O-mannosyl-transferase
LFKRMTGAVWRSAAVAALFALHPLRVESVAWVSERKDVLSTLFWFLTIWAYVRYADKGKVKSGECKVFYGLTLLFFALGLMSKPMLVTLPCTLLLLDYWPLGRMKQGASVWRLVAEKIPFFVLSAALCVVTFHVQKRGGMTQSLQYFPLGARLGNALVSYVRYIEKMFWPRHLAGLYPAKAGSWPWWEVTLAALLLLAVSGLVLAQWRRRPYLTVGWFWYLGTLVPVIGLVQVGVQDMADRYTYVPLIGLFVMLVWGGWELACAWRLVRFAPAATAVALAACAVLTVHQEFYWKDSETYNKQMIDVTPNNPTAHNNLGRFYLDENRMDDALTNFMAAVEENPQYAEACNNLGLALSGKGQIDEAISQYQRAISLKPDLAQARNNLGNAFGQKGQIAEAIQQFQEAIRLKPDFAEAHYNLGAALRRNGQIDEAISQYQEAIRLKPDYAEARNNLGNAFGQKGRIDEAISQYQEAIRLKPDFTEAHNNLGVALSGKGQTDEAIRQYQEVIRLKPDFAEARNNLGIALGGKGQIDEAIKQFQEAVRLKPDFTEARNNLVRALNMKNAPAGH